MSAQPRGARVQAPALEARTCGWQNQTRRSVDCFWLRVPESWQKAGGRQIRLPVVIFRSRAKDRKKDPVLFINGGPGVVSSTVAPYARWWNRRLTRLPFLKGRDLIIFDQRGVGGAKPALTCPRVQVTRARPLDARLLMRAVRTCARHLRAKGIDLTAYNTVASARDVAELRRQLRLPVWNLWGQSYGSRIALEVMRRHPAGVRSVILDGPYPPQVGRKFHWGVPTVDIMERLFRLCAADRDCARRMPGARAAWIRLLARFREKPVTIVSRPGFGLGATAWKINDVMLMWFLQDTLYSGAGVRQMLGVIQRLSAAVPDRKLLQSLASNFDLNVYGPFFTHGAAWAVSCNDNPKPDKSAERALGDSNAHLKPWIDDMLSADACPVFNRRGRTAMNFAAVKSPIPTLIVAGELDIATPAAWAKVAAEGLSQAQVLVFRGASHDVSDLSCAQHLMRRFLNAPTAPVPKLCLRNIAPLRFDWRDAGSEN